MIEGEQIEHRHVNFLRFMSFRFLWSQVLRGGVASMKGSHTPLRSISEEIIENAGVVRWKDISTARPYRERTRQELEG